MPKRNLFSATLLLCLSLVALASPLQAVPLQDLNGTAKSIDVWQGAAGTTPIERWKAPPGLFATPSKLAGPAPVSFSKRPFPNNDPCGFSQDWLAQHKNGAVICGTLADFYAPQITSHPAVQSAGISNGSRLILLLAGLFALLLATRRPVWISHLMR